MTRGRGTWLAVRGGLFAARRVVALAVVLSLAAPGATAGKGGSIDARLRVSPILVTLQLSAESAVVGQTVRAEARLTNVGAVTLRSIRLELRADRTGLVIQDALADVSQLRAVRSVSVSWSVCGRAAGSYVLLVRASVGGLSIDSPARLLTVTPGGRRSCP